MNPIGDNYTTKKNKSILIPLKIMSCDNCKFKQLSVVVNEDKLYKNFLYTTSTSKGLKEHFEKSFLALKKKLNLKKNDFILDIGSNDGSNLEIFKNANFKVMGVEPANALCKIANKKNIETLKGFFNQKIAKKIILKNGYPKLICIYNLIANVDELDKFILNIKRIMQNDTVVAVESFSLAGIVEKNLFDNIYHEHLSYFHILPLIKYLKKFNLEIFHAENNKIKGGSIKFYFRIKQRGKTNLNKSLNYEKRLKLNSKNVFKKIIKINKKNIININKFITKFKNKKIAGFGASCGSTVFLHYYKLTKKIHYFLDDEKRRNNLYSPSSNIKVYNPREKILNKIDIVIIISWRYRNIIVNNFKKKFPLLFNKQKWFSLLPNIKKIN